MERNSIDIRGRKIALLAGLRHPVAPGDASNKKIASSCRQSWAKDGFDPSYYAA